MHWSACETLIKFGAYYCLVNIHVLRNHERHFFVRFSTETNHEGKNKKQIDLGYENTRMVR